MKNLLCNVSDWLSSIKWKIKFNNNICDQIYSEVSIHFTKNCPNKCPFCIDALNGGLNLRTHRPDVERIFCTLVSLSGKLTDVTISGGEPFVYPNELLALSKMIKKYTNLKLTVITSLPDSAYANKEILNQVIELADNFIISPQHFNQETGDKIRGHKSSYDRNELLSQLPHKEKILVTINLIKGYLETKQDVIDNINGFYSLGYKNFKLAEMFDRDSLYVSIEKMFGLKMQSPFASGCSSKHFNLNKYCNDIPEDIDLTLKRVCFYKCKHCKTHLVDLIKITLRPLFAKKYSFGIIYENGELLPYWV